MREEYTEREKERARKQVRSKEQEIDALNKRRAALVQKAAKARGNHFRDLQNEIVRIDRQTTSLSYRIAKLYRIIRHPGRQPSLFDGLANDGSAADQGKDGAA